MSDPSFSDTVNLVKGTERKITTKERDFWNNSKPRARINLLKGRLTYTEVDSNYLETATENAYQQDYMAKINQLINTSYDSLPEPIRTIITEALIGQGALPNPKKYQGIGQEFAVGKEVFIECDRCDEVFLAEEDFDEHKEFDHGDHENAEEQEEAEDILSHMKDPNITKEAFREARRLLTETDEGDLHRSVYFNGDKFPQPTELEPDDIKGKKGYDDNPNKGLYDNKIFVKGKASSRQDGSVTEATEGEKDCPECGGELQKNLIDDEDRYFCPNCGKKTVESKATEDEFGDTGTGSTVNPLGLVSDAASTGGSLSPTADATDSPASEGGVGSGPQGTLSKAGGFIKDWAGVGGMAAKLGGSIAKDKIKDFVGAEGERETNDENDYEGDGEEPKYDPSETLSDITAVEEENDIRPDEISSIDNIDFAEEKIDYVYPTIKKKATEAELKDPFLEDYRDGDIESDKEAVENQIVSRKLHGYSSDVIAREITIQYGVPHEEALEKVYSIEVSVNDLVSNTFFGKRYHECTEAEKGELRAYSGSDTEDEA